MGLVEDKNVGNIIKNRAPKGEALKGGNAYGKSNFITCQINFLE